MDLCEGNVLRELCSCIVLFFRLFLFLGSSVALLVARLVSCPCSWLRILKTLIERSSLFLIIAGISFLEV